ncbi:MAG: LemA family protein [Candidatus Coprovivens sp.]
MENFLHLLLFVLVIWLIVYIFLEYSIINNKRKKVKKVFLEMDTLFIKRLNLLSKMIDIIKIYDKNQFNELSSNLYDYINNYDDYDYNKRLLINEELVIEIRKVLLVRKVYYELNNNIKYVKLEKQLVRVNTVINKKQDKYNKYLKEYINRMMIFPSGLICIICRFYSYNYFNLKI